MNLKVPVFAWVLLWAVSAATAQKEVTPQSDQDDEIILTQPTRAGNATLLPGAYVLEDHVSGGRHFIRFMLVEKSQELRVTRIFTGWYTDTREYKAGEVECRVKPLGATVQATTVTFAAEVGTPQITSVMVKGRAGVCIF
jgi:hypothetical protein